MTVGFVSLYVSEFFFAACGVSPLRGRPAIAQAPRGLPKGWTPTLFSLGAGLVVLCVSQTKRKVPFAHFFAAHYIAVGDFVTVLFKLSASFFFPYLTKVKLSEKKIIGYLSRTGSTKNVKLSPSIGIMRIGEDEPLKLSLTLSDSAALNASSR